MDYRHIFISYRNFGSLVLTIQTQPPHLDKMSNVNQIKSTYKHAFIYTFANVLQKGIGFLMLPIYTHYLQTEGYGIVGMVDITISVLSVFVGYGVQSAVQRFYYEKNSTPQQDKLISTSIFLLFVIIIVVCTPAYFLKNYISLTIFGEYGYEDYVVLTILIFVADMTSNNALVFILVKQRSILYSCISLLRLFIGLSLNIYLIVILQMGILGVLYSNLLTAVIISILVHVYTFSKVGFHFDFNDAKSMLKFGLPLIPGYIAMFIRNNSDRLILRSYLGLSAVGIFEIIFKFATILESFFGEPFFRIWSPKRLEICNTQGGAHTLARVSSIQFGIMLFGGLLLSVETPLLIKILSPEEFWVPSYYCFIAVCSRILFHFYYHFLFGLIYSKKTYLISIINTLSAFLSISMNLLLINAFGLLGALIASFSVYFVQCVITLNLAQRYYHIPFEWAKIFFASCIFTCSFFAIDYITPKNFPILQVFFQPITIVTNSIADLFGLSGTKLVNLINTKLQFIIEGAIKGLLAASFSIYLIYLDILPKRQIVNYLNKIVMKFTRSQKINAVY